MINNILEKIVLDKKNEVINKKKLFPLNYLEKSPLFERKIISLKSEIEFNSIGIIAEHKRRSPSKNNINSNFSIVDIATGYENAGASGMSILTDSKYFGGSLDDLIQARSVTNFSLLRKEFIIDEYQIMESKAYGADLILLIASILTESEIKKFSIFAKNIGLEVLLEVHSEKEIAKSLTSSLDFIGVNNRNLKTFEVNLDNSKFLSEKIPNEFIKISESGIRTISDINELKKFGYKGFLIGEKFMKSENPGAEATAFIKKLKNEI
jgi:indole-3-glycerol phosphate synthase